MRRTVKALVALVACLHSAHALQDIQVPHIELPQGCFDVLPGSPPPGWTGDGNWEANGLTFTDWEVVGSQISLSPSQVSKISVDQSLLVATVTFKAPISCDGSKTLTVDLGDSAWVHLSPSPGSFKLTCGASGVDHLLFQPAPVAGLVLQSIHLCPATQHGLWTPEGIPEPSCHGHGCGEHHVIMAESYYEETTESGCDTCHKGAPPSGPSVAPPSKGTKAPRGTPAPPATVGTKAPKGTPAPPSTVGTKAPKGTPAPPATAGTKAPKGTPTPSATPHTKAPNGRPAPTTPAPRTTVAVTTEAAAITSEAPAITTAVPMTTVAVTTEAPATTTETPASTPVAPMSTLAATTEAPATTTEEPTTAAPTSGTPPTTTHTTAPTTTTAAPTTVTTTSAPTSTVHCVTPVHAYANTQSELSSTNPAVGGLLSPGTGSITSFTFTAQLPGTVVQAQVYQWQLGGSNQNAGQPIGSSLYTSAPLTGTDGYSGLSQYTFTSTIHMTAGTQYVLYLQYISGPDGLVGNSLSYDSQAPSTAGRVTYYPQNSPPMWQGSLSGSIALTYTFCGVRTVITA